MLATIAGHGTCSYVWFVSPVRLLWKKFEFSVSSSYQLEIASELGWGLVPTSLGMSLCFRNYLLLPASVLSPVVQNVLVSYTFLFIMGCTPS